MQGRRYGEGRGFASLIGNRWWGICCQLNPLSMETIRIINEPDIIMNRSSGYELQNGEWKNQSWVSPSLNTTTGGSLKPAPNKM